MAIYELYAYFAGGIDAAKNFLERAVGVEFIARESSYHGKYFICGDSSGEHLLLKENVDMIDGGVAESEGEEYSVLLYANEIDFFSSLSQVLVEENGFLLLRREDI